MGSSSSEWRVESMSPKNRRRIASLLPNRRRGVPEKDCCTRLVSQIEENTPRKMFCYNWRSFHWSDPSDQTAQQWRCFILNTGSGKTLGSCHKEEWGLYWMPVEGFCKINNSVQYNKDCAELLKSPSYVREFYDYVFVSTSQQYAIMKNVQTTFNQVLPHWKQIILMYY